MNPDADDPTHQLELDPEAMRALGYAAVDAVVNHVTTLRDQPVGGATPSRAALEARLREPAPEDGRPWDQVLARLTGAVFDDRLRVDHPRFFGYVPGPSNFPAVVADFVAAGHNVFGGSWVGSPGAAQAELVTIDWLRAAMGLPEGMGGLFVSGGSMANLTALAAARHAHGAAADHVVYFSDQTHFATPRALRVLGFDPGALRELPSGPDLQLDPGALAAAIAADRRAGRTPFCVVANVGTTSSGAVDPLPELAALCRTEGLWLHGDGAYGAAAALCDRGRAAVPGLELLDSLAVDPHKWLFQPFEAGLVLVRDPSLLRATFGVTSAYIRDAARALEEVNFFEYGVQLTRAPRALKVWFALQVFGLRAFRDAVAHGLDLAEHAERQLRAAPHWDVATPASLGIVTFRHQPAGAPVDDAALDDHQRRLTQRLTDDGYALLSTTELHGRTVLRLCTINPRTTAADVDATLARLHALAVDGA
jgi:glutamate/tyrosine decarboxylase-like PLP-dependent enzyme